MRWLLIHVMGLATRINAIKNARLARTRIIRRGVMQSVLRIVGSVWIAGI